MSIFDDNYIVITNDEWQQYDDDHRVKIIDYLLKKFNILIGNTNGRAEFAAFSKRNYSCWRNTYKLILIFLTSLIAVLNLFTSSFSCLDLNIVSATFAILITLIANIDSFFDFSGKRKMWEDRENRLRLAAEKYTHLWSVFVNINDGSYNKYQNAVNLIKNFSDDLELILGANNSEQKNNDQKSSEKEKS